MFYVIRKYYTNTFVYGISVLTSKVYVTWREVLTASVVLLFNCLSYLHFLLEKMQYEMLSSVFYVLFLTCVHFWNMSVHAPMHNFVHITYFCPLTFIHKHSSCNRHHNITFFAFFSGHWFNQPVDICMYNKLYYESFNLITYIQY